MKGIGPFWAVPLMGLVSVLLVWQATKPITGIVPIYSTSWSLQHQHQEHQEHQEQQHPGTYSKSGNVTVSNPSSEVVAAAAAAAAPITILTRTRTPTTVPMSIKDAGRTRATKDDHPKQHQQKKHQEQQQQRPRTVSLIVRLRGEMGNLLSQWVFAKGIQWWMQDHGVHVELIGERQGGTKWKQAVHDLVTCFPNLRHLEYQGGKWHVEFQQRRRQQHQWLQQQQLHNDSMVVRGGDSDCGPHELFCLHQKLAQLQLLWNQLDMNTTTTTIPTTTTTTIINYTHQKYSLPFLVTNQLASFDVLVDQYYD